jgi:TRAP-type uncharacterized transport system substrate-binding protein
MVDPALEVLLYTLKPRIKRVKDGKVVQTGEPVSRELQFRAARDVLDRNGLRSKDEVVLTHEFSAERYSNLSDEELDALIALARKVAVAKDARD